MDFVHSATDKPVNSPFKFELWSVPNSMVPCPSMRIRSLERSWGVAPAELVAGEEKFVLKDGMTCVLRRPGHRDLRFTVPIRVAAVASFMDVDVADFPAVVS